MFSFFAATINNFGRMKFSEKSPKKHINVLHISATETWGGGENHLVNLCTELQEDSEVKNMVLCSQDGFLHRKLQNTRISHVAAPLAFKMDPRYVRKIGQICRKSEIDLLHIHDTTALSLTVMADHFYSLPPFILSKKTSFPIKDRLQTRYKYNYPKIRTILCVSEKTREITSKNILNKEKLKLIFHGTRIGQKLKGDPVDLRMTFNLAPEVKIIGNIANHTKVKNLEGFIEVADILVNRENRKDLFFIQIGSFSRRTKALKTLIRKKGLEDHLQLLNFVPNASELLPQFSLSVVTSENEGIPQFIYESFYHGIPVVSTKVGGIPEIIEQGVNGLLAEKHDFETMARHVLSLTENRELREKFIYISKKLLLERFSTELMAQRTLEEYKIALDGKH